MSTSQNNTSEIDGVCDILHNISTADNEDSISTCANCGKKGDDVNNICNKCKQVKYCNAACKKKHRHKHKKDCEEHLKQVADKRNEELRLAAELHNEKLFKEPPPAEDCPICMIRIPFINTGWMYKTCCGKVICCGCIHAPVYDNQGSIVEKVCAFCRVPTCHVSDEEIVRRVEKRIEANDPIAINNRGCEYRDGEFEFQQDHGKALELWHRAAELGYAAAYCCIGYAYNNGYGVEEDMKKATYYFELAAMGGDATARYNLGVFEKRLGNMENAAKHYMIAVGSGESDALKAIKSLYLSGHATKEDYTKALQSYQKYLGEIKSEQRDEAAAANDEYRYY